MNSSNNSTSTLPSGMPLGTLCQPEKLLFAFTMYFWYLRYILGQKHVRKVFSQRNATQSAVLQTASRPSVRLSVRDVQISRSHRIEYIVNNLTVS